jgi:hypothetical protein
MLLSNYTFYFSIIWYKNVDLIKALKDKVIGRWYLKVKLMQNDKMGDNEDDINLRWNFAIYSFSYEFF